MAVGSHFPTQMEITDKHIRWAKLKESNVMAPG